MKFIHCAIKTGCVTKSIDFYVKLFGFTVREKRYIDAHKTTLVFLKSAEVNFELELIAADNPKQIDRCENSFAHLAFQSSDLEADALKIKSEGFAFVREPFYSIDKSMKIAFVNDPNDITIELIEYIK